MSADALSDVLRAIRLRGAVFFYVQGADPWVAEAPPSREMIPSVLPGVDHLMEFHGVARGSCWAAVVGEPPVRLEEGDLVLFPQGDPHVLSSAPGMRARVIQESLSLVPRSPRLPFSLRVDGDGAKSVLKDDGGADDTVVVCGFVGCDTRPFNPFLASLPRMLPAPGLASEGSWLSSFLRMAVDESNQKRPGGEAVLERMTEMLFVEVLRRYAEALPVDHAGWLSGMRDPAVGRVLSLIHHRPAEPWTLERLGEESGMSRSTLHERFVHFMGRPPMQYLAQWRMQLASRWLRDTDAKIVDVAREVGYESEAAFARAFARSVGESPAAWRRARRAKPPSSGKPRT